MMPSIGERSSIRGGGSPNWRLSMTTVTSPFRIG
jgi:hypothetical protein